MFFCGALWGPSLGFYVTPASGPKDGDEPASTIMFLTFAWLSLKLVYYCIC